MLNTDLVFRHHKSDTKFASFSGEARPVLRLSKPHKTEGLGLRAYSHSHKDTIMH